MDQISLNTYLSRVLSGIYIFLYRDNTYKLRYPNIDIKYEADVYAEQEYIKNRFNDWINTEDILSTLMMIGVWNPILEKELEDFPKKIEDLKVDLYKNAFNSVKIKSLKKNLKNLNNRYNFLYGVRHSLDHLTPSGYASLLKSQYILVHSLYDNSGDRLFEDIGSVNFAKFNALTNIIHENIIPADTFREIARSDLWRNYWSANKERMFNKPTVEWTDEQKTLVIITKMYDNAYEHPECPSDNIINDDDMFDGWMIMQRRENEKDKNKKRTEKMLGDKLNKAGEVFLVANSKEEIQNIYDLNDAGARHTIREREKTIINSDTEISVTQLPDIQRDIIMEQNRLYKEKNRK